MPGASKNPVEGATFVGGFVTRGVLVGFRKLGLPPERLCAAAGRPPQELMDPATRVPSGVFWSMWREESIRASTPESASCCPSFARAACGAWSYWP